MWDVQALGDWKENRILLTGDNSSEQLVLAHLFVDIRFLYR